MVGRPPHNGGPGVWRAWRPRGRSLPDPINWSAVRVYHRTMRGALCRLSTGSFFFLSLLFGIFDAAGAVGVPRPGERFNLEERMVTEGTISATGEAPLAFTQLVEWDLTASVLEPEPPSQSTPIDFVYRRVSIEVRLATDSAKLELFPNRMVLDGTPLYDAEAESDEAPPVLSHLLNESFRIEVGEKGEIVEFVERRRPRRKDAFLDLAEPIRSLWVEIPSGELIPEQTWSRFEPLRMLGDLLLFPATATYTVRSVPNDTDPLLVLTRRLSAASEGAVSLPARIGYAVPGSLRTDALGPDLFAPPPSARFENLVVDATETLRVRADWRFLQSKQGTAKLALTGSLPQVDGPRRYQRHYDLRRTWTLEIKPVGEEPQDTDVRYLLYGGGKMAIPLDSFH